MTRGLEMINRDGGVIAADNLHPGSDWTAVVVIDPVVCPGF